ncbi:MAG: hypothetical protein R3Y43_02970 [Alphaproteobacteria bacterium]
MDYREFNGVEDAWFWFCATMTAEQSGFRPQTDAVELPRICDKHSFYKILKGLKNEGALTNKHLRVISFYGQSFISPLYDKRAKHSDKQIWKDAMYKLEKRLIEKGVLNAF